MTGTRQIKLIRFWIKQMRSREKVSKTFSKLSETRVFSNWVLILLVLLILWYFWYSQLATTPWLLSKTEFRMINLTLEKSVKHFEESERKNESVFIYGRKIWEPIVHWKRKVASSESGLVPDLKISLLLSLSSSLSHSLFPSLSLSLSPSPSSTTESVGMSLFERNFLTTLTALLNSLPSSWLPGLDF